MKTPAGQPRNLLQVARCIQRRDPVAQPLDEIGRQFAAVVIFYEAQEAAVPHLPELYVMRRAVTSNRASGARHDCNQPRIPITPPVGEGSWRARAIRHFTVRVAVEKGVIESKTVRAHH